MSLLRRSALAAWYYASLPLRRVWGRYGMPPVTILFYHRVADSDPNPWTISTRRFARQIGWLQRNFDLVSLKEAQRRIVAPRPDRPAVAITFDDGYAENCDYALPLLLERRIPCTYFVATRFVFENAPFPHDVNRGTPLPVNTPEQIVSLARAGIEIGAHTRNHVDLGAVTDDDLLEAEVVGAKHDLETLLGCRVNYFAFPFGMHRNLNAAVFPMARQAGYAGVCSAYGGYNLAGGDPFHLQRFHGDPDLLRLKNWASADPWKAYTVIPFHYQPLAARPRPAEAQA